MSAKSIATQRMLFAASNAQRSPFGSPLEAINVRALRTSPSSSPPVTPVIFPVADFGKNLRIRSDLQLRKYFVRQME